MTFYVSSYAVPPGFFPPKGSFFFFWGTTWGIIHDMKSPKKKYDKKLKFYKGPQYIDLLAIYKIDSIIVIDDLIQRLYFSFLYQDNLIVQYGKL